MVFAVAIEYQAALAISCWRGTIGDSKQAGTLISANQSLHINGRTHQ